MYIAELAYSETFSKCCGTSDNGKAPYSATNCSPPAYIYKWKNHFYEMKGDVGMSVHEKERKQEDAYTKTQTHS